jgi:hypothetical protein
MFSKIAGYKINTQKEVAFLYTNNEHSEKEIRKTISFTIASKNFKYQRINLTKEVTDLYNKKYKSRKKEINEDIRRCPWISRNQYMTESNLYVQCNPYQNSNDILHRNRKVNPKVHMEAQKTLNSQSNPEPKEQCWRYHNTRLQTIVEP